MTNADFRDHIAAIFNPQPWRTYPIRHCDGCGTPTESPALHFVAADGRNYCAACLEGGN